jgi:hypothetical protein
MSFVYRDTRIDPAAVASKLPTPAQKPVGAVLGGLMSVLGGDDPSSIIQTPISPLSTAMSRHGVPKAAEMLYRMINKAPDAGVTGKTIMIDKATGRIPPAGVVKSGSSKVGWPEEFVNSIKRDPALAAKKGIQDAFDEKQRKVSASLKSWDTKKTGRPTVREQMAIRGKDYRAQVRANQDYRSKTGTTDLYVKPGEWIPPTATNAASSTKKALLGATSARNPGPLNAKPETVQKILDAISKGATPLDIAQKTGMSPGTIRKIMASHQVN